MDSFLNFSTEKGVVKFVDKTNKLFQFNYIGGGLWHFFFSENGVFDHRGGMAADRESPPILLYLIMDEKLETYTREGLERSKRV